MPQKEVPASRSRKRRPRSRDERPRSCEQSEAGGKDTVKENAGVVEVSNIEEAKNARNGDSVKED